MLLTATLAIFALGAALIAGAALRVPTPSLAATTRGGCLAPHA